MNGTQSSSSGSESSEDENDDNDGVSGLLGLCQDTSPPSLTLVEAEKASVKALFERSSRRTTQLIESPASRAGFERRQKIKEAEDRRKKTAPNIDRLFKMVLSWDIERIHDRPPNIPQEMYHSVKNKYTSFDDYVSVFEPLLLLETWAQLARSREFLCEGDVLESWVLEGRCHVNDFVDVTFMVPLNHVSKMSVDELVFVADHFGPGFFHQQGGDSSWKAKSFLGKIMSIIHKRAVADITMRCYFPKECITVLNSLAPKTTWKILRLMSMTTTQREYAAIQGLEYYDLVKEVISPENTPKPPIDEQKINHYVTNYGVNRPQATAIAGAITREKGFTLIQGPPGTGKTKTILGLIVSLLEERGKRIRHGESSAFGGKIKILVCAPSNAAVDEIAKRLKDGIKTVDTIIRPNIVRIGVADSVNASVKEFVLDRLIEKELGAGVDDQMSNKAWSQRRDKLNDELRKLQLDLEQLDRDTSDTKRDPVKMATLRDQRKGLLSKRDEIKVQIKAAYEDQKDFTREMEVSKIRARQKVFSQADVVCATLSGSGHDMLTSMGVTFDTVIVDEAAQSIEISTLIPLKYDCRRCVLVGDPNQLPPTVLSQLASKYNYEQSLFMRLENVVPQDVYLLSIQYRMHPAISAFPSQLFYNSKLQDGPRMSEIASAPWHSKEYFPPYRFYNVEDGQEKIGYGHSIYNPVEADAAVVLVDMLANQMPSINFAYKIGVITPYKQQLSQLKSRFEQRFGSRILDMIDFNTVDGFQGQEKEIIIFSCVRTGSSRGIGFLSDIRRMNVGLTRAKCSLFVLGNAPALIQSQYWGDLVRNAYDRRVLVNVSGL
ncbi:P-loop containing nucleoside triphosphate hydrolase protein [Spinellus fusiger]|nr:P-loop containing nucleoside triphosphate hydrolase protein [Spinellus fusiger]